jgi:hypothetical protein
MGVISKKLASRLRKAKKLLGDLRRQVAIDFSDVPRNLQGKVILDTPGYDPLHAAYIAAQNFTGLFMEEVTKFPEFDSYWGIYGPAQKEYMPSGPPRVQSPQHRRFARRSGGPIFESRITGL